MDGIFHFQGSRWNVNGCLQCLYAVKIAPIPQLSSQLDDKDGHHFMLYYQTRPLTSFTKRQFLAVFGSSLTRSANSICSHHFLVLTSHVHISSAIQVDNGRRSSSWNRSSTQWGRSSAESVAESSYFHLDSAVLFKGSLLEDADAPLEAESSFADEGVSGKFRGGLGTVQVLR